MREVSWRLLIFLVSVAAALAAGGDLVLHPGKIVTVDGQLTVAQAVAVKSGKIVAVGSDSAILQAERGPRTEVIDLQGRTVLPGLVDAHVHALEAALSEFRGPIPALDSF